MSDNERIVRPTPERTEPIRSWSTLLSSSESTAPGERGTSLQDVVSRSVDLGYRVVDDYIRRGQKAAQRINERSYSSDALAAEVQEIAKGAAQYTSDFAALWFDFLQVAVAGNPLRRPGPRADGVDTAAPGPTAPAQTAATPENEISDRTHVRIEVAAACPTEVSLDLHAPVNGRPLLIHALRSVDPDKPRLTDVTFHHAIDGEPASLRIRVPDNQPSGMYSGLIIDEETSRPVGTLSVRIAAV